jgi:hypothetical protein
MTQLKRLSAQSRAVDNGVNTRTRPPLSTPLSPIRGSGSGDSVDGADHCTQTMMRFVDGPETKRERCRRLLSDSDRLFLASDVSKYRFTPEAAAEAERRAKAIPPGGGVASSDDNLETVSPGA